MNSVNESQLAPELQKPWYKRLSGFLFDPHPSVKDVAERRRAQLTIIIAFALTCTNAIAIAFIANQAMYATFLVQIVLTIITFFAYLLSRSSRFIWGGVILISSLVISGYANVIAGSNNPTNAIYSTIPIALVLGSALLPVWGNVIQYIVVLVFTMALPLVYAPFTFEYAVDAVPALFTVGLFLIVVQVFRDIVERARLREVQVINQELRALGSTLEQRVADRTKALATSAEVTRRLAAILDPRQLATEVVEQVQAAFQYYYAQIYLLDDAGENLVIAAGTGEAGASMLARGHSLPKGRGLVGRAAETRVSVLIPDVSLEAGWLPNELLPETRAEAAVPISFGDQVLGVLDIQHDRVNGLTAEDVTLLESLAGQVAITLQNARSYEVSRRQAELESLVNQIGQKIQRATNIEDTLQTAVRELGTAIGAARVSANIRGSHSVNAE